LIEKFYGYPDRIYPNNSATIETKPLTACQLSRRKLTYKDQVMGKEKSSKKETKKAKAPADDTKKQKKDPKRHDGPAK
jgi:hypothetical protein